MARSHSPVQAPPSRHRHAGSMEWHRTVARCTGCGQRWRLGRFGWTPVPTWGELLPDEVEQFEEGVRV